MSDKTPWTVGYDGPSRPIIIGPNHQMISVSMFKFQSWGSFENEEAVCQCLCDKLNELKISDVEKGAES